MWETQVQFLSREDSLEKEMATHSSTLTWKIPWTEESVSCSPWDTEQLDMISLSLSSILVWEILRQSSLAGYSLWGHKRVRHGLVTKQKQYVK